MTDKRFTLTTTKFDGTLSFYDAKYDCETRMSTEYVLDKVEITLNALHEKNSNLETEIMKLRKENKKLRAQIDIILSMIQLAVEEEVLKSMKGEEMYPLDPEGIDHRS